MPKREDDIKAEIQRLDDGIFERFVRALLSRNLYPGLNPTSQAHDLGEDARTEPSTLFLNNGKWISLLISKEHSWGKVEKDCLRCKKTGRQIDILIFVTVGNPRTDTIERWKRDVSKNFNWILEVRTIEFLAPYASSPEFESLVDDYLLIPPPSGDFIQDVVEKVNWLTKRNLAQIRNLISGTKEPIFRTEIEKTEKILVTNNKVVLTGDAGIGKSGIVSVLVHNTRESGKIPLLIDARNIGPIQSVGDLRSRLDFVGPTHAAIQRLGRHKGCRLIIDQLDNIAGLHSADLVLELVQDLSSAIGVEIVAVCRNIEDYEKILLEKLISFGFVEIVCNQINDATIKQVFSAIGIEKYSVETLNFAKNLLNLDLIAQIQSREPGFNFAMLTDEVNLWEKYIELWCSKDGWHIGNEMIAAAIGLAKKALNHPDSVFIMDFPPSTPQQRLISWGILTQLEGRRYRFHHEKFQDFVYAKDATDRGLMPKEILGEILEHKSRNIFTWVTQIYKYKYPDIYIRFLEEVFNV